MTSLSRQFWVVLHRWAGLTIAVFLIVAGATGALLPFNEELTDLTAPWRVVAPPRPGAPLLDAVRLNEAAQRHAPRGYSIEGLRLDVEPGHILSVGLAPHTGSSSPYLEAAIDPYTGKLVHLGRPAAISEGWDQLMPFLYALHYKFAIDDYGVWAFGIAALIWTLDCFIGFYLTLPVARRRWWSHWRKAWKVRASVTSIYKLNFDLHRAGGLWLWPILFVFAWSSVGMNLRQVYDPVMKAMGAQSPYASLPDHPAPKGFTPDWRQAYAQGQSLARQEGNRLGFSVLREGSMFFDAEKNSYSYNFQSNRDFTDKGAWSAVLFYPDGKLARTIIADGGLRDGGADNWFMALHTANVGGLAYRIFVSVLGLAVVALSVTGVVIWMKKRSARLLRKQRVHPMHTDVIGPLLPAE